MLDERKEIEDERIRAARAKLVGRMDMLERRIVGAVDVATESVRETAGVIRHTVTGAADEVRGIYVRTSTGVRQVLDVRQHIRDYPWPSVGMAAFTGFLSGFVAPHAPRTIVAHYASAGNGAGSGSSVIRQLADVLKRELKGLGETAILAASAALKNNVQAMVADCQLGSASRTHHHNGIHAESI